ncbi:MAG TPA: DUF2147 domain-containing protein [Roseiarcus sp.]|nr:DUF2147 domain-containing protein [Roseiarcus sp.]
MVYRSIFVALALAVSASVASAGDVAGVWLRDNGESKVRFAPCGAAICGTIVWLKDTSGPAKVGERVFYEMVPAGDNAWSGKAFEPASGKEYTGKMTLSGNNLTTAGCVFGGLICKSIAWTRSQ